MALRHILLATTLVFSTAWAEDAGALRDLVDHLRDLEAQIALIERESATPVDRAALWAGATRGLVQATDPHAAYLSPDDVVVRGLSSEPQRLGLGFDWYPGDGPALITRVVPGSPAALAGIHPGCRILSVDGVPADQGRTFAEALVRGADAKHLVVQDIDSGQQTLDLTRAELTDDGLAHVAVLSNGVLHVRIGRFMPAQDETSTATATAMALRQALEQTEGLRAVVLDLRGCAGGTLQAAVEIAAGWIPPGIPVIEQVGRDPARNRAWTAQVPRLPDVPVVVLIDHRTASAAEVLALALHRTCRSPVLGTPSQGKWSAQQFFLLPRGDAILLTVAHLRPPGGEVPDGPLQPSLAVPQDQEVTWRRWRAELAGAAELPEDPQLQRACELADVLASTDRH